MGRVVYGSINAEAIAADATQDAWSIIAGTNKRLILHGFEITASDIAAEIIAL